MATDELPITGLVLHFRTPERTLACLRSLSEEGIRCAVVVDNSEDRGASVAAMVADLVDLRQRGMQVGILSPEWNLGFAKGVAVGLTYIRSNGLRHVLLINSDAYVCRGAVKSMRVALNDAGVVVPHIKSNAESHEKSSIVFYNTLFALYLKREWPFSLSYPSGTCFLIRDSLIESDLFDPDFFFYGEDVKLGHDLTARDITIAECADAIVLHAGSASAKNGSMFYEYHMNRAHWLLARKLAGNPAQTVVYVVARCVTLPLRALVRSVRYRSMVPWRGLYAATLDVIRGRCRSFTPPAQ